MRRRRALPVLAALAAAGTLAACGTEDNKVAATAGVPADVKTGSVLFAQRCSGCHTLDSVGAQGGATVIGDRERVDGPNFNVRKECHDDVLYAIRNGGYSGAIMPENIVVGKAAEEVASFLVKYSGVRAKPSAGSTPIACQPKG